jgi:hypothetical protein
MTELKSVRTEVIDGKTVFVTGQFAHPSVENALLTSVATLRPCLNGEDYTVFQRGREIIILYRGAIIVDQPTTANLTSANHLANMSRMITGSALAWINLPTAVQMAAQSVLVALVDQYIKLLKQEYDLVIEPRDAGNPLGEGRHDQVYASA